MSSSMLFRLLCSLLYGGALALGLVRKRGDTLSPEQKWAPEVTPWLLPLFLALLFAVLVPSGEGGSLTRFGGMCMGIFLQMSIYYAVLLALGSLLRSAGETRGFTSNLSANLFSIAPLKNAPVSGIIIP